MTFARSSDAARADAAPNDDGDGVVVRTPRHALLRDVWTGACVTTAPRDDLAQWPELRALAATPQDPAWHAEGDVLTHTDMVLAEAAAIAPALGTARERGALRLACLLHDIAKPGLTRFDPEVRHVIARGHERAGGVRARYLLHGTGLRGDTRRAVAALVATHHLVKRGVKGFDTPDGPRALDALAARVDTRLLWALELADMRGRAAVDRAAQIEIVELFRMLCEERGVFGRAPTPWLAPGDVAAVPFVSPDTAAWALAETERRRLNGALTDAHHALAFCHAHAAHRPARVVVTVGAAGSGKSHAVAALGDAYERISPDADRKSVV
jgi:putative nucleotidyltransferase with HDIG domain